VQTVQQLVEGSYLCIIASAVFSIPYIKASGLFQLLMYLLTIQ
jgi:hypothetical protein